ncbi:uncharacterized protein ACNS7B_019861 [Menidia menidia]
MACVGVLLLLTSSLLLCTNGKPADSKAQAVKENVKNFLQNHLNDIRLTVVPFLSLIPVAGVYVSPILNAVLLVANGATGAESDIKAVKEMLESLNLKLDENQAQQTWHTWASSTYSGPETDINLGWDKYVLLSQNLNTLPRTSHENEIADFKNTYANYEPAVKKLHQMLTDKGTTFTYKIGDNLAEYVHCHDKAIRQFSAFIHILIFKGNLLNQFYYHLQKLKIDNRVEEAAKLAYDAGKAMFDTQRKCISESMTYVRKYVESLIDEKMDRKELAVKIQKYLDENYDLYSWMVVAYKTKGSAHDVLTSLNRRVFSGFEHVSRGEVTVSVARQVKGGHEKAKAVGKVITSCLSGVKCVDVPKKLEECQQLVDGRIKVKQTYVAVHAYKGKDNEGLSGVAEDDDDAILQPETSPYYVKNKCKKISHKDGWYTVMVKSDRDLLGDPCKGVDCGAHGKCEVVPKSSVGVCVCDDQYYGKSCEGSMADYKENLKKIGLNSGPTVQDVLEAPQG